MCRVAMWNKDGEQLIEKKVGLVAFMEYLERAFGGHGNGFALLHEDGRITMKKGVHFSCEEIADIITKKDYKWCVFHTRIASVGSVRDENCHPFRFGDSVLAMNGTESGFGTIGDFVGITDTEAVLRTAKKFKKSVYDLAQKLNSVFMGFENGVPFVTAGGSYTDLEMIYEGKAVCFASEFPIGVQSYEPVKKPFAWHEGKEIQVVKAEGTKRSKKWANSYYYDRYDDEYWNTSTTTKAVTTDSKGNVKETNTNDGEELLPKVANGEDIVIPKDDETKLGVYLNEDRDAIDEIFPIGAE